MSIRDLFRISDPARLQENIARLRGTASAAAAPAAGELAQEAAAVVSVVSDAPAVATAGAQAAQGSLLQRLLGTIDHGRIQSNVGMLRGAAHTLGDSSAARGVAELAEAAATHEPGKVVSSLVERLGKLGFRRI